MEEKCARLLSTTVAPAAAEMGPNFLLMEPPAENSERSMPLKLLRMGKKGRGEVGGEGPASGGGRRET